MKNHILSFILFILFNVYILCLGLPVHARTLSFVGVNNAGVTNDIYENDQILNLNGSWDYGTNIFKNNDPLWYNTGLYFYSPNINGDILQVNADFYFGVVVHYPVDSYLSYNYTDYTSTDKNPFKPENLRCSVAGEYADGYDSTYVPEVTNWSFQIEEGSYNTGGINKHFRYHLKFNYKQKLSVSKIGSNNISCWFQLSNPNISQGQFFGTSDKLNTNVGFLAKTNSLLAAVNSDPNTGLLIDIVDQNKTMINQNQQIIDKVDGIAGAGKDIIAGQEKSFDYVSDNTDIDTSQIDGLVGYLPPGPLDSIINLPLSMLNSMQQNLQLTCAPLSFPVPFVPARFEIPCISTLYEKMGATTLINSLGTILATIILYKYFLYLYNWVDNILSLKSARLKGWGSD